MAVAALGQLNVEEEPPFGVRSVNCFHKIKMIGKGTYGEVFMARDPQSGEIVALKKFRMYNQREGFPLTALREIQILMKLRNHQHIVQLKEIVTENESSGGTNNKYSVSTYLVFEYMDHDLAGLLRQPGLHLSITQIKSYMQQLLRALQCCHDNHVLHRDIKAANLLIDKNGVLKLADFGLARTLHTDNKLRHFITTSGTEGRLTNRVITLWYRPPELLLGSTSYGPAVDLWSVGCIFAELLHGVPILQGSNELDQLDKIFDLCGSPNESIWPGVSELPLYKKRKPLKRRVRQVFHGFGRHALDLLNKMLCLDPSKRITAKDALNAEYFSTEPLPAAPKSLPNYQSSHILQTKNFQRGKEYRRPCVSNEGSNQIPVDMDISPDLRVEVPPASGQVYGVHPLYRRHNRTAKFEGMKNEDQRQKGGAEGAAGRSQLQFDSSREYVGVSQIGVTNPRIGDGAPDGVESHNYVPLYSADRGAYHLPLPTGNFSMETYIPTRPTYIPPQKIQPHQ